MDELTKCLEQMRTVALKLVAKSSPISSEYRIALAVLTSLGTVAQAIGYEQDRLKYEINTDVCIDDVFVGTVNTID